jgi:hypothetical protein
MTETQCPDGGDAADPNLARLRERFLRDLVGDCLPLAHFDYVAAQLAPADAVAVRQTLLTGTVRSLLEDGLIVVGRIVGGSDERVDPWDLSLDDAMSLFYDEYVVHHDDQNWAFGTWFALTDSGEHAAEALETEQSEG